VIFREKRQALAGALIGCLDLTGPGRRPRVPHVVDAVALGRSDPASQVARLPSSIVRVTSLSPPMGRGTCLASKRVRLLRCLEKTRANTERAPTFS